MPWVRCVRVSWVGVIGVLGPLCGGCFFRSGVWRVSWACLLAASDVSWWHPLCCFLGPPPGGIGCFLVASTVWRLFLGPLGGIGALGPLCGGCFLGPPLGGIGALGPLCAVSWVRLLAASDVSWVHLLAASVSWVRLLAASVPWVRCVAAASWVRLLAALVSWVRLLAASVPRVRCVAAVSWVRLLAASVPWVRCVAAGSWVRLLAAFVPWVRCAAAVSWVRLLAALVSWVRLLAASVSWVRCVAAVSWVRLLAASDVSWVHLLVASDVSLARLLAHVWQLFLGSASWRHRCLGSTSWRLCLGSASWRHGMFLGSASWWHRMFLSPASWRHPLCGSCFLGPPLGGIGCFLGPPLGGVDALGPLCGGCFLGPPLGGVGCFLAPPLKRCRCLGFSFLALQDDARIDLEVEKIPAKDTIRKPVKKDVRPVGAGGRGPLKGAKYTKQVDLEISRLRSAGAPEFLVSKSSFCRLVAEQVKDLNPEIRMSSEALKMLQWAAEGHISQHLARAASVAGHAGRVTITKKDFDFVTSFKNSF